MKKADIGLIGLAVMGENLVMNMELPVVLPERTSSAAIRWRSLSASWSALVRCL